MPELPEVETIRRGLEKKIVGLTLQKIDILTPKTFQGGPERAKRVEGKNVLNVWRRAKMLGVNLGGSAAGPVARQASHPSSSLVTTSLRALDGAPRLAPPAFTLLFHLKMTGQLIYVEISEKQKEIRIIGGHPTPDMRDQMPNKSTRVIFEFSDGSRLFFNDQRKFGWVKVLKRDKGKEISDKLLGKLGPEPLEKDFSWEILKNNLLRHKSMPVKVALMDQSIVAGIGNIYSSEILFLARIDPRRKVSTLSDEEFKKVYRGIKEALETAIKAGGSTRAHFVNVDGERGYFLDYANVYGKEGQSCNGCKGKVEKISQAGRGTYFCPSCQM